MSDSARKHSVVKFKAQSAMEYLMTHGWAVLIIAVVLVALFALGLFSINPATNANTCVPISGYECASPVLDHATGDIVATIGQSSGTDWTTVNLIFVPSGTAISSVAGLFTAGNEATVPGGLKSQVGQLVKIPANVMLSGAPQLSVGQSVSGTIWAQYTQSGSLSGPNEQQVNPNLFFDNLILGSAYYTHLIKSGYFTEMNPSRHEAISFSADHAEFSYTNSHLLPTDESLVAPQLSNSDSPYTISGVTGQIGSYLGYLEDSMVSIAKEEFKSTTTSRSTTSTRSTTTTSTLTTSTTTVATTTATTTVATTTVLSAYYYKQIATINIKAS